tara:strand:- start:595 stop:771 length:177 start_codon:yes stop_codon:yes gene_type:complete
MCGEYRIRTGDLSRMLSGRSKPNYHPQIKTKKKLPKMGALSGEYRIRTGDLLPARQAL